MAEREEITVGLAAGESLRAIAARLGRSPSTVSREVRRNSRGARHYRALAAQGQAQWRAARPKMAKLAGDPVLRAWVQDKLARIIRGIGETRGSMSGNHPPAPGQARAGQVTAALWLVWVPVVFGLLSGTVSVITGLDGHSLSVLAIGLGCSPT